MNWSTKGCDPLGAKGCDPLWAKGCDPLWAKGCDPLWAKGCDPLRAKGCDPLGAEDEPLRAKLRAEGYSLLSASAARLEEKHRVILYIILHMRVLQRTSGPSASQSVLTLSFRRPPD